MPLNLPVPIDDGACDHLLHMHAIPLNATLRFQPDQPIVPVAVVPRLGVAIPPPVYAQ